MNAAAVIPVYNPEPGLEALCKALADNGFCVVVVDDGSTRDLERFLALPSGVTLLKHPENRGKGRAIKTALAHLSGTDCELAVFADGDGQHRIEDILAVCERSRATGQVALGVRNFLKPGIPLRSRFGNLWTSMVMFLFCGYRIGDTQTGLRCIPRRLWGAMLELSGERFEYEMRLFPLLKKLKEPLEQVPIETIYIASNRTSHFRPLVDSVKIYRALFSKV